MVRKVIKVSLDFSERLLACRGWDRFTGLAVVAAAAFGDVAAACALLVEAGNTANARCPSSGWASAGTILGLAPVC